MLTTTTRNDERGIVAVMDRKEAQNIVYEQVVHSYPQNAHRVGIWNGDAHRPARAATCMNYCTPQSLLHRLLVADSASDVQHYIYVWKQWHAREPKPCRNNAIGFTFVDAPGPI